MPFDQDVMDNVDVHWTAGTTQGFNPTHLYYNLYDALIEYWLSPATNVFTILQYAYTHHYPNLVTSIEPAEGSLLLTDAVAIVIIVEMMANIVSTDMPALWTARLTTKG